MKIYIINSQSEHGQYAFKSRRKAIRHVEELTGKPCRKWEHESGDYIEDTDDMIWITVGELYE